MNWIEIITYAGYEEQAECVASRLDALNITTLLQLQNSTGKLGHICQVDIYALVAAVNKVFSEGLPVEDETSAVVETFDSFEPEEQMSFEEDNNGENEQ